jgi:energy-coupling factor transporter ATP-binding protein EcfA2
MRIMGPATTLREAYSQLDPRPLEGGDPRHVDCTKAWGDDGNVLKMLAMNIEEACNSGNLSIQLLGGHRGCGKSTELKSLALTLKRKGYYVVYVDADDAIDIQDVVYTDVLLAIIRKLHLSMDKDGFAIDEHLLEDIIHWFAAVFYEWNDIYAVEKGLAGEVAFGASLGGGLNPLFAKLLGKLSGQIKTGSEAKKSVRAKVEPEISQLTLRMNLYINAAKQKLCETRYRDLVIIVDNLEKITLQILDEKSGRTSHDALFLEHGAQLRSIDSHVIYTVPISMFYSQKASQLYSVFPSYSIIPMIRVSRRGDDGPDVGGIDLLVKVAKARIDVDSLFEPEVVEWLAQKSGGVLRDFIRLLAYSIGSAMADDVVPPLAMSAARRAFNRLITEYGRSVPFDYFPDLALVARDKRMQGDGRHQIMLYNLMILEYINEHRWCDVHPAIKALPEFEDARKALHGT